jgi:methylated-DNA-[protein]-cysteine S-methyltransferase
MQDKFSFCLERVPTPVGCMLLIIDSDNIVRAIDWEGYEERMHRLLCLHYGAGNVTLDDTLRPSSIRRTLERYLDGDLVAIDDLPVKTGGTPFQREVWQALRQIPAGQTTTYGDLATQIGRSKAVRAVGLANGANRIRPFRENWRDRYPSDESLPIQQQEELRDTRSHRWRGPPQLLHKIVMIASYGLYIIVYFLIFYE